MSYEHDGAQRPPRQVRLPLVRRPIGLGDVVAGMTRAVGIQPCAPCERRKRWLNERLQLVPRGR